jgi:small subunit ribosomal protein S20
MRSSERKRIRNRSVKSAVKTFISKAEALIRRGELESARSAVVQAVSALDKAAEKGIIHANNAARRKSRLMKKFNAVSALAQASQEAPVEPKPVATKKRSTRRSSARAAKPSPAKS